MVLFTFHCRVITLFEYVARTQACMRCSFHFQVTIGYSINKPKDFHPKFNFLHFIGYYVRNLKVKRTFYFLPVTMQIMVNLDDSLNL